MALKYPVGTKIFYQSHPLDKIRWGIIEEVGPLDVYNSEPWDYAVKFEGEGSSIIMEDSFTAIPENITSDQLIALRAIIGG